MAFHYFPVRLIRLIKTVALFGPLFLSLTLLVLLVNIAVNQTRLENARIATEKIHEFLEKTSFCERLSEETASAVNGTALNATVLDFCRQFELDQRSYFSRRTHKVNVFDHKVVRSADGACNKDTYMVVLVHSLHSYRDRRDAIRSTWGGAARNGTWPLHGSLAGPINVRVVFIFGQHTDARLEASLEQESQISGDIVQGDFIESYTNMTLKSLLGLKWVLEFCPSVRYLFKCDDDMFVNVAAILNLLRTSPMTWSVMGPLNRGSKVYRRGKWGLTKKQYPFYYYPPYESGSGYAISADLIHPLFETSDYVPWIFIDDVYITGILGKILSVGHVTRSGFAYWTSKSPSACEIANSTVLTGTRVSSKLQLEIWKELVAGIPCLKNSTMKTTLTVSHS